MLARDRNIRRGSAPSDRLIVLCFSNGSSFVASPPPSPPRPSCVIFIIDPANKEPFNLSPHLGVSTLIMGREEGERRDSSFSFENRDRVAKLFSYWHSIRATNRARDLCNCPILVQEYDWLVISWNGWSVSGILGIPRMLVFIENVWKVCACVWKWCYARF